MAQAPWTPGARQDCLVLPCMTCRGTSEWLSHASRAGTHNTRSVAAPLETAKVYTQQRRWLQAASDLTDELFECLAKPHGLRCHLVQSMTGTHLFSSAERNTAEQYVGVLRELPADDQSRGPTHKKNIERFVWEFLANRTYSGDPHDVPNSDGEMVGCDNNVNTCPDNEVRLPVFRLGEHPGVGRFTDTTVGTQQVALCGWHGLV